MHMQSVAGQRREELHETGLAGKVDLHVSPGLAYRGKGRPYPEGGRLHCAPPELPYLTLGQSSRVPRAPTLLFGVS